MQIIEPVNNEHNVTVTLQVPVTFYLHGKRSEKEYEEIAIEHLRNIAGDFSKHVSHLAYKTNEDGFNIDHMRIIEILGDFGSGLMEAIETVQLTVERGEIDYFPEREGQAKKQVAEPQPAIKTVQAAAFVMPETTTREMDLMMANKVRLAVLLYALINHPDTPERLFNTLCNAVQLMGGSNLDEPFEIDDIDRAITYEKARPLDDLPELLTRTASKDDAARLAHNIAGILRNPLTPGKLYSAIVDELSEITGGVMDKMMESPEVIKQGILNQIEKQPEAKTTKLRSVSQPTNKKKAA